MTVKKWVPIRLLHRQMCGERTEERLDVDTPSAPPLVLFPHSGGRRVDVVSTFEEVRSLRAGTETRSGVSP